MFGFIIGYLEEEFNTRCCPMCGTPGQAEREGWDTVVPPSAHAACGDQVPPEAFDSNFDGFLSDRDVTEAAMYEALRTVRTGKAMVRR